MKLEGAVIREQGVVFAIAAVKGHAVRDRMMANKTIASLMPVFSGIPVVLMAQDSRGVPAYYGRKDIANFMVSVPLSAIPWKTYHLN